MAGLLAFRGIGTYHVPATPSILSNVYNSVCLTRMLYGIEVLPISYTNMNDMEHAHLQHAKLIQGLPKNIATPAPLATLGWLSVKALISKMKILFLIRTLLLPLNNIYRRVAILKLSTYDSGDNIHSPIEDICKRAQASGLLHLIMEIANNTSYFSYEQIKHRVKTIIKDHDILEWRATCLLYHNLNNYSAAVHTVKLHTWWVVSQKIPHVYKQID